MQCSNVWRIHRNCSAQSRWYVSSQTPVKSLFLEASKRASLCKPAPKTTMNIHQERQQNITHKRIPSHQQHAFDLEISTRAWGEGHAAHLSCTYDCYMHKQIGCGYVALDFPEARQKMDRDACAIARIRRIGSLRNGHSYIVF